MTPLVDGGRQEHHVRGPRHARAVPLVEAEVLAVSPGPDDRRSRRRRLGRALAGRDELGPDGGDPVEGCLGAVPLREHDELFEDDGASMGVSHDPDHLRGPGGTPQTHVRERDVDAPYEGARIDGQDLVRPDHAVVSAREIVAHVPREDPPQVIAGRHARLCLHTDLKDTAPERHGCLSSAEHLVRTDQPIPNIPFCQ